MKRTLIFFALLVAASWVQAATLVVHNTGVDNLDELVAAGAPTAFWTLSDQPAGSLLQLDSAPFRYKHPAYADDSVESAWVSPNASGNAGSLGVYVYDLIVDLTGFDPSSAVISGVFGTDNSGSISLNGQVPVASTTAGEFGVLKAFTFSSGFVTGLNLIHVSVNNQGDPTAFHVLFGDATAAPVPVPATLWLLGSALGVLGWSRRSGMNADSN
ncbi:MAG: hypothetical protein ACI8XZ_002097 [Gammaproteobacteria bacterium]|jgi:hypothetical protein